MQFLGFLLSAALIAYPLEKKHLIYLMQFQTVDDAIVLYEKYKQAMQKDDFEVLILLATRILQEGIRSNDATVQLSSLFGIGIANLSISLDILEQGIKSQNFETQLAAIQLLAHMQDDRSDELLTKAMASPFLMTRMEAGFYLAHRKHRKASGQIEALMYKIPKEFWVYFPQFFALIGTVDAIEMLKKLMEDPLSTVRVEAILSAARFGRDDLLSKIRAHATHLEQDEQEACATALGLLKDSKSIPLLQRLASSSVHSVKLAALFSLYRLGNSQWVPSIFKLAQQGNLFAISLLGELPGSEELLYSMIRHQNIHIRWNATLSLLKKRDRRSLEAIEEFLMSHSQDLGFQPCLSLGHSFYTWKVIASAQQYAKEVPFDLHAITLHVREQLLKECLELPNSDFVLLSEKLFQQQELSLIPCLIQLLENHPSEATLTLLKRQSECSTSPLIRNYCNLALYRLHQPGPYESRIHQWVVQAHLREAVQFRPSIPWSLRQGVSPYELTPEEHTRLLFEIYLALSERHDEKGIALLLRGMKEGHTKNRYALAGLLIHALQ